MYLNLISHYLPEQIIRNDYFKKVNGLSEEWILSRTGIKERRKALLYAISATQKRDLVEKRGHEIQNVKTFPVVIDDKLQTLKKTSQVIEVLNNIGQIVYQDGIPHRITGFEDDGTPIGEPI